MIGPTALPAEEAGNFRFLKTPPDRDVVFVFGAGASVADGAPLQHQILPFILFANDTKVRDSAFGGIVRQFILDHFSATRDLVPSLESVFAYLDYFINTGESLGGEMTVPRIGEIRQALIKLTHYSIGVLQKEGPGLYKRFWETSQRHTLNVSVISLNYDTLVDEAFDFLYPSHGFIDYCVHFMNYDCYDKLYKEIGRFNWWINPREPVPIFRDANPTSIKLLKLHGSLNWKYCRSCRQVLLTPWDAKIDLDIMGFARAVGDRLDRVEEFRCPIDNSRFDTLIMHPSHIKEITHPVITLLRDEAARELRAAKKVVFVGYSMPDADVHLKALLRKSIVPSAHVIVVDPHADKGFRARYTAVSQNARFVETTFEHALRDLPASGLF